MEPAPTASRRPLGKIDFLSVWGVHMKRLIPFIVCFFVGLGAGIGITLLILPAKSSQADASHELALVSEYLKMGKMQDAYDALLAAMRVKPSDYDVFQASLKFVETATKVNTDEAITLATDIHERAANIIPFLPLTRLKEARQAHTVAGEALFPIGKQSKADDPFAETEMLLAAITQPDMPSAARASLLREVEGELNSQVRRIASMPVKSPEFQTFFWDRWKSVRAKYDSVQKEVLDALYQDDCRLRLLDWRKKVADFNANRADCLIDKITATNTEIIALMDEGTRIYRDLTPYLEAAVESAIKDNGIDKATIDRQLMQLSQLREWNYNRWVLDRIAKVQESGGKPFDRLKSLLEIDETRLSPYAGQQFADIWKKLFDDCQENEKVEATKLRMLQGKGK